MLDAELLMFWDEVDMVHLSVNLGKLGNFHRLPSGPSTFSQVPCKSRVGETFWVDKTGRHNMSEVALPKTFERASA